jgi:transposase-like protein
MIAVEVFRYKAELKCPECTSANIDRAYGYMGEYWCRHCNHFWRSE